MMVIEVLMSRILRMKDGNDGDDIIVMLDDGSGDNIRTWDLRNSSLSPRFRGKKI
jgi:hypothetical protein